MTNDGMTKIQCVGHHSSLLIHHLSHLPREHAIRHGDAGREADERRQPKAGDFVLSDVREVLNHAICLVFVRLTYAHTIAFGACYGKLCM
jgi:hypothetical protein